MVNPTRSGRCSDLGQSGQPVRSKRLIAVGLVDQVGRLMGSVGTGSSGLNSRDRRVGRFGPVGLDFWSVGFGIGEHGVLRAKRHATSDESRNNPRIDRAIVLESDTSTTQTVPRYKPYLRVDRPLPRSPVKCSAGCRRSQY